MKLISGVKEVKNFFGVKIFGLIASGIVHLYYMQNFRKIGLIVLKLEQFEIFGFLIYSIVQIIVC